MKLEDMERYFTRLGPDQDLLRLASYDKLELIKELVENRGANVNARSAYGDTTPLHEAAEEEKLEILRYLISKGADINALNSRGQTPLDISTSHRLSPLQAIELLKHSAQTNTDKSLTLEKIIRFNHTTSIDLVTRIQNINNLEKAAGRIRVEDREKILSSLKKEKIQFMKLIPKYCTAVLKEGILEKQEKILKTLQSFEEKDPHLNLGIKFLKVPEKTFPIDDYKLQDAFEDIPIKDWFRSEDPYVDLQTFVGVSALPLVIYAVEELKLDLNHFKNPTLLGLTLAQGTEEKTMKMARYLLQNGVDVDIKDSEGFNLFDRAIMQGQEKHIKLLMHYNPDLNIVTSELSDEQKGSCLKKLMDVVYFNFGEIDIATQIRYMFVIGNNYDILQEGQEEYIRILDNRLDILIDWFLCNVQNHIKDNKEKAIERRKDIALLEFLQEGWEENKDIIALKKSLEDGIIEAFLKLFKNTLWEQLEKGLIWKIQEYDSDEDLFQLASAQEAEAKATGEEISDLETKLATIL